MAARVFRGLVIRKLADKSAGVREVRYHPVTGERYLHNPMTPGFDPEPWPLAGIQIEGDPVEHARIPTSFVTTGRSEGWISVEGERLVIRSGGPPENPWKIDPEKNIPHMFSHHDVIVIHTVDGDLRYRVIENADKWPAEKLDDEQETGFGGEVRWFYDCELEA